MGGAASAGLGCERRWGRAFCEAAASAGRTRGLCAAALLLPARTLRTPRPPRPVLRPGAPGDVLSAHQRRKHFRSLAFAYEKGQ